MRRLTAPLTILAILCAGAVCSAGGRDDAPLLASRERLLAALAQDAAEMPEGYHVRGGAGFVLLTDIADGLPTRWEDILCQASARLRRDFFTTAADTPVLVYLFRDRTSYMSHAGQFWHETPESPYGYYARADHRIVCNAGTGPGTMVHELVHALMETDFPDAPVWISEGLASLYEQCDLREDALRGLDNWRLPDLQKHLMTARHVPLETLFRMSYAEFSDTDAAAHYALARYFCLYLEERGLLRGLYAAMRDARDGGASAGGILQRLAGQHLIAVDRDFRIWAARRQPERIADASK